MLRHSLNKRSHPPRSVPCTSQTASKHFTSPLKLIELYGAPSSAMLVKTTSCLTNDSMTIKVNITTDDNDDCLVNNVKTFHASPHTPQPPRLVNNVKTFHASPHTPQPPHVRHKVSPPESSQIMASVDK